MLAVETEYVQDITKELDDSDLDTTDVNRNMNTPALVPQHAGSSTRVVDDPLSNIGGGGEALNTYEGKTLEHFFVTTDHGAKKWDTTKFEEFADTVLGVRAPFVFYLKNGGKREDGEESKDETVHVLTKVLRDFENVQKVEEAGVKRAILDFSFHLTCDNLDEAYNSVRGVNNVNVWKALALMCVKSRRLDVA